MLNVQEYLLTNSLDQLKDEYDINVKEYDDFYVFNYGIKSPRFHPIADECRSLILSKDFKNVYCRSFNRFYNYGEGDTGKNFNFSNATCYEKLDGSYICVFYYNNTWVVSSKGSFASDVSIAANKYFIDNNYGDVTSILS
jgi:alpha-tubulin suppressor-like RCC1 family protein